MQTGDPDGRCTSPGRVGSSRSLGEEDNVPLGQHADVGAPTHTPTATSDTHRVIRPAAVLPDRAAREIMAWLDDVDVTRGGCWMHDVSYIKRFSGPFDGIAGMRGSAVLLGSLHITWDRYSVTIYRVNVTDDGVARGLTVDRLCDEVLRVAGLSLATCPRADLTAAPVPDPFRRGLSGPPPIPRSGRFS
jgi:hypothetical protein